MNHEKKGIRNSFACADDFLNETLDMERTNSLGKSDDNNCGSVMND